MICENCIHNAVCKYGEARSNGLYCTGEKCKQYQSTDVVPKSEVKLDFTEEEIMRSLREADIEVSDKSISEIKAEVAREIFEEIEKYKRSPMPECKPVYVINDSGFAELKKKYTEGKT